MISYLRGPPPFTATFNTNAYINIYVDSEPEQESLGPAQKKRKTGMDKIKWLLQCNDNFPKPVRHEKALRSNVTMKKRTWLAIKNDTNERSHLNRKTTHPENYYQ